MFTTNHDWTIRQKTSQFFAAEMLTQEWAQHVDQDHQLFRASSDIKDEAGHVLVTVYAVHRPDGQWALMIINKDYDHPHTVRIVFHNAGANPDTAFAGPVERITFGKEQYVWHSAMRDGYADPDGPAAHSTLPAGTQEFELPAASMTVLRGRIGEPATH
jgi:hypothetical protein